MSEALKPRVDWRTVLHSRWHGRLVFYTAHDLITRRKTAAEYEADTRVERAYRRGYTHGYSQAMDDMLGMSKREYTRVRECWNWLARFFDDHLYRWRHDPDEKLEPYDPPRIAMPEKWSVVRKAVHQRDKKCVQCGSQSMLEVDHIVSVADGGVADLENLRLLCAICHRERSKGRL